MHSMFIRGGFILLTSVVLLGCEAKPVEKKFLGGPVLIVSPADPLLDQPDVPSRFLALGDSYTIGEGVSANQCWPEQLVKRLREQGVQVAGPSIIARTGWTTTDLSAAIDNLQPKGTFTLVSLMIGVNNQFRGRPVEEYRTQFRELLGRAVAFADGKPEHVLVLSIPDYGVTPAFPNPMASEQINLFNEAAEEETKKAGAHFVEITKGSRAAGKDPTLLAGDKLHPSSKMYEQWVDSALPLAAKILQEK